MAAGASSRMGRDKALLPWQDTSFLGGAIRVLAPLTDMVLVVAGKNFERLAPVVNGAGAFLVENPDPDQGQFSSLRIGVQEVLNRGRDAAIITLVDRPPARPETVQRLKQALLRSPDAIWAVVPRYGERNGHPLVVGRQMITAFLRAPANSNAREVEHAHAQQIQHVEVDDPMVILNVDTPEDYQRIRE